MVGLIDRLVIIIPLEAPTQSYISETFSVDIQGPVSSGLGLQNCSYSSLSLDHPEFPRLSLETETDFSEPQTCSRNLRLTL